MLLNIMIGGLSNIMRGEGYPNKLIVMEGVEGSEYKMDNKRLVSATNTAFQ